ncbi:MAG: BsuPI-related putative proteinase inhibitor [Nitriliruptorales bacterium]|nr:BsuPI-related putative proteinase inhibitor [Nitriliruptorales bacterium]
MDELERRLRDLRDLPPDTFDAPGTLGAVVANGRRKAATRLTAGGITLALAAMLLAVTPAWTRPGEPTLEIVGTGTAVPSPGSAEPTTTPEPVPSETSRVEPLEPAPTTSVGPTARPSPTTDPRVELTLSARTADRHAHGEPITFVIEACNEADRPHDEFFFNEAARFDLSIITADNRRIAYTVGRDHAGGYVTETWATGECRTWTETWDQTEGFFDDPDDGPQVEPGDYTVQLEWRGVQPPPPGLEPGLYDPAGRLPERFGPFTVEEPTGDGGGGVLGG